MTDDNKRQSDSGSEECDEPGRQAIAVPQLEGQVLKWKQDIGQNWPRKRNTSEIETPQVMLCNFSQTKKCSGDFNSYLSRDTTVRSMTDGVGQGAADQSRGAAQHTVTWIELRFC